MPMPNLQDFEGKLFRNFEKKGQIVRKNVSTEIAIYCNNIVIILLVLFCYNLFYMTMISLIFKPYIQVFSDKRIVIQVRI